MKDYRKMTNNNLHCGACLENFDSMDELNVHLESCPAAKILMPYIITVSLLGADAIGHPVSHFIHLSHKHAHTIKRYAYAVADDLKEFERAKIHFDLCWKMGIEYDKFRPFEMEVYSKDNPVSKIPSRQEAEEILWYALVEYFDLSGKLKKQREFERRQK